MELVTAALAGERRALARLLTLVENGTADGQTALAVLYPHTGRAHVIGVTGSPGAGKSTLVGRLARELRNRDLTVAIVAVDPSSPYSGGALLGDRLRMRDLTTDAGIFIRSMASRGHPGGVAHATREVVQTLDAVGYPVVIVETVGAGQAQVDVARVTHTVVLVEAPGMGDDVQALKAGLMEIADIIVVNKADRPEAKLTLRSLQSVHSSVAPAGHHGPGAGAESDMPRAAWEVPLLLTSALEDTGLSELADTLAAHRRYLEESGQWEQRLAALARAEVETWLQRHLLALLDARVGAERREAAVAAVLRREQDPASVARALLEEALA